MAVVGGCVAALVSGGCSNAPVDDGTDAGAQPRACPPLKAADAPGTVSWTFGNERIQDYWLLKREEANDRCMFLHLQCPPPA